MRSRVLTRPSHSPPAPCPPPKPTLQRSRRLRVECLLWVYENCDVCVGRPPEGALGMGEYLRMKLVWTLLPTSTELFWKNQRQSTASEFIGEQAMLGRHYLSGLTYWKSWILVGERQRAARQYQGWTIENWVLCYIFLLCFGGSQDFWEGSSIPFEEDQAYSANPIRMYSNNSF